MKNSPPNLITLNADEYTEAAAIILRNLIKESDSHVVNIALSGGSTPMPIYEKLSQFDLNWENIRFFLVDERCVPNSDDQSNYKNIKAHLFDRVPSMNYPMIIEGQTFQESANTYEDLIKSKVESINEAPQFDLIVLGMGLDGHTASLFPNTKALQEKDRFVVLNDVPQLNTQRITMTYPILRNAKRIILLIKGEQKDQVFLRALSEELPVSNIIGKAYRIINEHAR